jgi:CHAT domain-containing protein/tetratricopeptide (TPR) repeat protein
MTMRTLTVLGVLVFATGASVDARQEDATALMREGFTLLDKSQHADAATKFEACVTRAKDEANRLVAGQCTRGLGRAAQARRDFAAARVFFESAHDILAGIPNHPALGQNYNDRALLAYVQAIWPDVREFYGRAIVEFETAGMKAEQAAAMRSQTFTNGMPFRDRVVQLEKAWVLAREAKAVRIEALILHHWGDMLYSLGEYAASLEKTQRAIPLLESAGDHTALARALTSLGRLYRAHGAPQRAVDVYRRVLAMQEQGGDTNGQAQTHTAIASAIVEQQNYREAVGHYERALDLVLKNGGRSQITFQRGVLANSYVRIGKYAEGLALARQVIAAGTESDDLPAFYSYLGGALSGLGRFAEAEDAFRTSIALSAKAGHDEWEIDVLAQRSQMLEERGRVGEALADLETAATVIERMRTRLPPLDFFKSGFHDRRQQVASRTIALLTVAGRNRDAMTLAEQQRARAFLDLLATRESAPATARDGSAVTPAASVPAPLGLTMRGGVAPGGLADFDLASAATAPAPTEATLRTTAARLKATLVSYWVGADVTVVWAMRPDGEVIARRVNVTTSHLQRLIRRSWSMTAEVSAKRGLDADPAAPVAAPPETARALSLVTMRGGDPIEAGGLAAAAYRELYDLLIHPVREFLPRTPGSLLTIVPHGPLFELSFAALTDPRGRYLLEDYQLHYVPSAATLAFTERRTTEPSPSDRYLFIANPATAADVASPPLSSLPGADREISAVTRLVGAGRATTLSGRAATEDMIRATIGRYRVVHFATHGLVSSDRPFDSFLAVAPGTNRAAADGRLTAAEIYGLDLSADLIVLSACRAAGGKISGDGIVGLTRAFFAAGTPSIVAALWDMADESAEHLLPRFYAEWQKTPDKARALRAAQLSMLRDLRAGKITVSTPFGTLPLPPHPALWANLVLIGEPR